MCRNFTAGLSLQSLQLVDMLYSHYAEFSDLLSYFLSAHAQNLDTGRLWNELVSYDLVYKS